jgi:hypothetical protein
MECEQCYLVMMNSWHGVKAESLQHRPLLVNTPMCRDFGTDFFHEWHRVLILTM